MCGRYFISKRMSKAAMRNKWDDLLADYAWPNEGEIAPSDTAPVFACSKAGHTRAFSMQWGYTFQNNKRVINARSETAYEKPLFRDGIRQRRCLIPANCYFEWQQVGKERIKYAISAENQSCIYIAGIYRLFGQQAQFTVLTRDPITSIAFIHDRMPLLIADNELDRWLNSREEINNLLTLPLPPLHYECA